MIPPLSEGVQQPRSRLAGPPDWMPERSSNFIRRIVAHSRVPSG